MSFVKVIKVIDLSRVNESLANNKIILLNTRCTKIKTEKNERKRTANLVGSTFSL